MSTTHGGRNKEFDWRLVGEDIFVKNEDGRVHVFSLSETHQIIHWLKKKFGNSWFPLANNVESLSKGEEKNGLGVAISRFSPGDVVHAQGSSYLGVVLEEVGVFQWNGVKRGIHWRIMQLPQSVKNLRVLIINFLDKK